VKKLLLAILTLALFSGITFAQEGAFTFAGETLMGGTLLLPQGDVLKPYYQDKADFSMNNIYGEYKVYYDNPNVDNGTFHGELTFRGTLRDQTGQALLNPVESVGTLSWLATYENDQFKIAAGLNSWENTLTTFRDNWDDFEYLYGWYNIWHKQIKFEVAYKGYDFLDPSYGYSEDLPLASDIVSGWDMGIATYDRLLPWWGNFQGIDGARITFKPDFFQGLIVRAAWRDLFTFKSLNIWWVEHPENYEYSVQEYLETFTLFARYDVSAQTNIPLALSFGYANRATKGLHLGASYMLTDKINIRGDILAGGLVDVNKYGFTAFGFGPWYHAPPLYLDLNIRFGADISTGTNMSGNGNFQIEPIIRYAIISNTVLARFGITYTTGTGGNKLTSLALTPGLYWNIKGDMDTEQPISGMRLTYAYGFTKYDGSTLNMTNSLTIAFYWSFGVGYYNTPID